MNHFYLTTGRKELLLQFIQINLRRACKLGLFAFLVALSVFAKANTSSSFGPISYKDDKCLVGKADKFILSQTPELSASVVSTNVTCYGGNNGSIVVTVTGGAGGNTYLWNSAATTKDLKNLIAGIYKLTITDANGNTTTVSVTITEPSAIVTTAYISTCVALLPYTWNSKSYYTSGTYSVHLKSEAGCDSVSTLVLTVNTVPVVAAITGTLTVAKGLTTTLSDSAKGGLWNISDTSVASVDNGGLVTGRKKGTATITYTLTTACGSANTSTIINVLDTTPICALTAKFGINKLVQCITDNKFVFTDSTTGGIGAVSYFWNFNDGTSSTEKNPVHIYGKPSDHDISLTVKDSYGCGSGYLVQITVGPVPNIGFKVTPNTVDGHYLTFNDTSRVASGWLNYSWDFGDKTGSTLSNPSKLYSVTGTYNVTLTISASGGCNANLTQIVNAATGAMTSCTAKVGEITGIRKVCLGITTQLSDTTANGVWSSSDATIAKVSDGGLVTGLTKGNATISYGVSNKCGIAFQTVVIAVDGTPEVDKINTGVGTVSVGSTIQLKNSTFNGVWSSLNKEVATISDLGLVKGVSSGVDTIYYSVSNNCGTTRVASVIIVSKLPPITGLTSVCKGASINLSETVSHGTWSVSDSTIASVIVISKDSTVVKVTGKLKGTILVTFTLDSSSVFYAVTVNGVPQLSAISGPSSVVIDSIIQLANSDPDGIWSSFNLSVATINTNGVVKGIKAGIDTLSYKLSNICGPDSIQKVVTVIVPIPVCALKAKFGINSLVQCITDNKFVFTDSTTGGIGAVSYYWDFNDGTSSRDRNPVHVYGKPSDHDIALTVKDSFGCSSGYLLQVTVGPVPQIGFKVTPYTVDGHYLTFNDTSRVASGWLTYAWDFGDKTGSTLSNPSKLYTTPGVYPVVLTIAASGGCKANLTQMVNSETGEVTSCTAKVGEIKGTRTICVGTTTQLSDTTAKGVWSSSDATIAIVTDKGLVTGLLAGSATISYGVSNSCGIATQTAVITIGNSPDVSNITGGKTIYSGLTVQLANSTSDGIWASFNNVVATISAKGLVTGISSGVDTISYSVSNLCGTTSVTSTIKVITLPPITGPSSVCKGDSIILKETVAGGIWSISAKSIASMVVIIPDSTSVKVTGILKGNVSISYTLDSSTVSYAVAVNAVPTQLPAITGAESVITGSTIQLANSVSNGIWKSLNTAVATVDSSGKVTGIKVGKDTLAYTVSNDCGSASILFVINVKAIPPVCALNAKFSINSSVQCIKDNKFVFKNLTTGAIGDASYYWDFGDESHSTVKEPVHEYKKSSNYNISLTVKDSYGCSSSYLVTITVGPEAKAAFKEPCITGNGMSYTFENRSSVESGWLTYEWDFGDGNTSTLVTGVHTYSLRGNYTVKLTVSASGGCKDDYTDKLYVKNTFKVSNNPTSTTTTITYVPNSNNSVIYILNEAKGIVVKTIKNATISGSLTNNTIDLSGLPKGTYSITIKDSKGELIGTSRVVKL